MKPSVAKLIAGLSPQQVRAVALRERHGVRLRLASDGAFWRELLQAAIAGDEGKLTELHLHAKLSFCNGLVKLRK